MSAWIQADQLNASLPKGCPVYAPLKPMWGYGRIACFGLEASGAGRAVAMMPQAFGRWVTVTRVVSLHPDVADRGFAHIHMLNGTRMGALHAKLGGGVRKRAGRNSSFCTAAWPHYITPGRCPELVLR